MVKVRRNSYNGCMKRRRELGPRKERNRSALIKFLLLALLAAVIGVTLSVLVYTQIETPQAEDRNEGFNDRTNEPAAKPPPLREAPPAGARQAPLAQDEKKPSGVPVLGVVFGFLVLATVMTVLGLVFFGVRAYLLGIKVQQSLTQSRGKLRRT